MEGRDMIGRARTGTGKTLAFGIPIMDKIIQFNAKNGYVTYYLTYFPIHIIVCDLIISRGILLCALVGVFVDDEYGCSFYSNVFDPTGVEGILWLWFWLQQENLRGKWRRSSKSLHPAWIQFVSMGVHLFHAK